MNTGVDSKERKKKVTRPLFISLNDFLIDLFFLDVHNGPISDPKASRGQHVTTLRSVTRNNIFLPCLAQGFSFIFSRFIPVFAGT